MLVACGKNSTLRECIEDATMRPTTIGVQVAIGQCRQRFPTATSSQIDQFLADDPASSPHK